MWQSRFAPTPRSGHVREEMRREVENAPIDHAEALLGAYKLLQEAQDHGVLDTLRGVIGAGDAIIGKISEYANTPEVIRLIRNLLAMLRIRGELDTGVLDALAKAFTAGQREKTQSNHSGPPSLLHTFRRLTSKESRRTLATIAELTNSLGSALSSSSSGNPGGQETGEGPAASDTGTSPLRSGIFVTVAASALGITLASFWMSRRHSSDKAALKNLELSLHRSERSIDALQ